MEQLLRNQSILSKYIPLQAVEIVSHWIVRYNFKLKIKKKRTTVNGDYTPPHKGNNHVITINNNLNKYAFLITLVHEIAHLRNWEKNKNAVKPHGPEWKIEFELLSQPFINNECFPQDILDELKRYLKNPAASGCTDLSLSRILKKYDQKESSLLEELPLYTVFETIDKRVFVKLSKKRKRFLCREVATKKEYLFYPLVEVKALDNFL